MIEREFIKMFSKILEVLNRPIVFRTRKGEKKMDKEQKKEVQVESLDTVISMLGAVIFDANEGNLKTTQEVATKLKPLVRLLKLVRASL